MKLSLIIPVLNEEESLPILMEEIHSELSDFSSSDFEIILIDDGSKDSSWQVIAELSSKYPIIKGVRFQYNKGKATALAVGFDMADGDIVITMDADLQDNPAEIKPLMEMIESGYDLISGWKKKRHDPWHKTIPSKLFNWVTSKVAGVNLHDFNCGLKAYNKIVVKNVKLYGDFHRYIPVMAHWMGFKVGEKIVEHRARQYGVSKYGVSRLFSGGLDLITLVFLNKWAVKPLHFFGLFGLCFSLIGTAILGYFGVEWIITKTLHVRPLMLMGGFSILMGIQFISLGLLGEMISGQSSKTEITPIAERLGDNNE